MANYYLLKQALLALPLAAGEPLRGMEELLERQRADATSKNEPSLLDGAESGSDDTSVAAGDQPGLVKLGTACTSTAAR
jgi:hypothetical protein